MDKEYFQSLIQKQLDGKLTKAEEVWLETASKQLFDEEIAAGADDPTLGPDDERGQVIRMKIHNRIDRPAKYPFKVRALLKVAAVITFLTFSSVAAYKYRFAIMDKFDPIAEHQLTAGNNAVKMVVLEDGSVIWLNKNSRIKYPERFRGDQRKIQLQGEAYFQVAHNIEKPFIVKSGSLDVQVLGTTFVVTDAANRANKAVTVLTGKVSVAAQQQQIAVLLPNQQVTYDSNTNKSEQHKVNSADAIAFTKQDIDFRDTPLSEILLAIETRFDVQVHYTAANIKDLNFSGLITKGDKLKGVLDILSNTLNFKYQINDDNTVVIIKTL